VTPSRPTVLVLGPTGAGKTSLLQAVFGEEPVPEERIGHGRPATKSFDWYQAGALSIVDSKGLEPADYLAFRQGVDDFIRAASRDPHLDRHVHVVWYAIPGPGARVTAADLHTILGVSPQTVVPITKSDITRPDQLADLVSALRAGGVPDNSIVPCSVGDRRSIEALLGTTEALFDAGLRRVVRVAGLRRRRARRSAERVVTKAVRRHRRMPPSHAPTTALQATPSGR
jgi:ethanolamine utilization protein EutP (predicted NTPase)